MKISIRTHLLLATAFLAAWALSPASAWCYDSGSKALGTSVGATDFYRVSCGTDGGTPHHLSLTITDATPISETASQLMNFHVSKDAATADATAVTPGETRELALQAGNGRYTVAIDTVGTNTEIPTAQRYKLGFQCLNASGENTRTSIKRKAGKLKNSKVRNYGVKCRSSKLAGDTDRLLVAITDTTPIARSPQVLNAQLAKGLTALNVADRNGDEEPSPEIQLNGGSGDYLLTVDNTGTDSARDNSKIYTFVATCADTQGSATTEPAVEVIQDQ
jgi:hypothetical protein